YGDGTSESTGHHVTLNATRDLHVDYVETAVDLGAQKAFSDITLNAGGRIYEMAGTDGAARNTVIDLYAHVIILYGTLDGTPIIVTDASVTDTNDARELEIDFTLPVTSGRKSLSQVITGGSTLSSDHEQ